MRKKNIFKQSAPKIVEAVQAPTDMQAPPASVQSRLTWHEFQIV